MFVCFVTLSSCLSPPLCNSSSSVWGWTVVLWFVSRYTGVLQSTAAYAEVPFCFNIHNHTLAGAAVICCLAINLVNSESLSWTPTKMAKTVKTDTLALEIPRHNFWQEYHFIHSWEGLSGHQQNAPTEKQSKKIASITKQSHNTEVSDYQ